SFSRDWSSDVCSSDLGDTVAAGDVLMRLDDTFDRSDLAVIESQLHSLLGTAARLKAEQDETGKIVFDPELLAVASARRDVAEIRSEERRVGEECTHRG